VYLCIRENKHTESNLEDPENHAFKVPARQALGHKLERHEKNLVSQDVKQC
jgi:hypothetical protein